MRYILLFLFLLLTPSSASAVWFDSNWDYRVKIEVAPSKVGTTTAITSFPVYVNLANLPASFLTNVKSDGSDIRVTESDGSTETAFEVVTTGIRFITTATENIDTSTTTWQLPAEALSTTVTVKAWGGGGGGGDGANTGGGGGGGGAYASSVLVLATSTNYTIDIGAGGAKGAVTSAGANGATTTFNGGQVLAAPGIGGLGCSAINCAGGAGGLDTISVGSTTISGTAGGTGLNSSDVGGVGGAAAGEGGGAGGAGGTNAGSGANGSIPGGGGGGGENNSAGSTGNGASGRVSVIYSVATTTQYFDGELHFLADNLSTTSTSTFYIYYGNPSASAYAVTDTYGRNAVWTSYGGVWHLADVSTDSTSNGNNGTDTNVTYATTSAKISVSASGNGSNTEIDVGGGASIQTTTDMSVSGWFKLNSKTDAYVFSQTKTTSPYGRWIIYFDGGGKIQFLLLNSAGTPTLATSVQTYATSTWYHVYGTISGTAMKVYVNGIEDGSNTFVGTRSSTAGNITMFQRDVDGVGDTPGSLDELRYINSALTPAWILTEYNNQSSPSTFLWIGAEECDGGCGGGGGGSSEDGGVIWFD